LDKWTNFIVLFCIGLTSKFDTIPLLHPLQWFILYLAQLPKPDRCENQMIHDMPKPKPKGQRTKADKGFK
jgi:hypothetical protein